MKRKYQSFLKNCGLKRVCVYMTRGHAENPVMNFSIKQRIKAELFIDKKATLYIGENWIRVVANE